MNIEEINAEGLAREIRITIPAATLAERLDAKIDSAKDGVHLKGFRPGKVPAEHLKKTFGKRFMSEVVEEAVGEASREMFESRAERPALQPQIDLDGELEDVLSGAADLVYTAKFEILPSIKLVDFKKLKLSQPVVEADEARLAEAMERLAAANRTFAPRPKTAKAKMGDRVKIDFTGSIDGTPFEGGAAKEFELELGSGQFIPGFEEGLVGVKSGDDTDVKVSFPADYGNDSLAGKDSVFAVHVHEVLGAETAKIDDEFAQKMGLQDLAALKDAVRAQMDNDYRQMSRAHLKRALLDRLDKDHDFDLPPSMVELEFTQIWRQYEQETQGKPRDEKDEEAQRAEYRGIAERRVRTGLILAEVGRENGIEVSDAELNRGIQQQVQQFPDGDRRKMEEYFRSNPQAMGQIRAPILEEKVIDFICEMADVSDRSVSIEELMASPDAAPTEEKPKRKKPVAKKAAPAKKPAAKKAPAKKPAAKKAAPAKKKPAAKKAAPAKKAPAKKTTAKKAPAKKSVKKPAAKAKGKAKGK